MLRVTAGGHGTQASRPSLDPGPFEQRTVREPVGEIQPLVAVRDAWRRRNGGALSRNS
jgi:hypothetical protein